ncbi:MAG: GNAT family N-acetyltransferase [Oscillospiraceae bacterium]|nr:GNAT family N-acetyltransferase [Oscillospiraceae bacterium]
MRQKWSSCLRAELKAGALLCRSICERDREAFTAMHSDPAVYLQNGRLVEIDALFSHYLAAPHAWAIELDGAFIGTVALSENSLTRAVHSLKVLELSFSLLPAYWGRGLASQAVQAVCSHAFSALSADAVLAGAFADNPRSHALLSRLGFGDVLFSRPAKDLAGNERSEQLRLLVKQ